MNLFIKTCALFLLLAVSAHAQTTRTLVGGALGGGTSSTGSNFVLGEAMTNPGAGYGILSSQISPSSTAPPWTFTVTGESSNYFLEDDVALFDGAILGTPAWIGAFVPDGNGGELCVGYSEYLDDGNTLTVTVFGDDQLVTPGVKDGATSGETITWKVWYNSQEYLVSNIAFEIQSFFIDGTNFTINGLHKFSTFEVTLDVTQVLTVSPQWKYVALYVESNNRLAGSDILGAATDLFAIKRSGTAPPYITGLTPDFAWDNTEGYMVIGTSTQSASITAALLEPENLTLNAVTGWQMEPYTRNSPMNVASVYGSIPEVLAIKRANGDLYFPSLNINNIGDAQPGEGFLIYFTAPLNYTLPANGASGARLGNTGYISGVTNNSTAPTTSWIIPNTNTGVTSNYFLPDNIATINGVEITAGAFVGAFVPNGNGGEICVGFSEYLNDGNILNITVFGDDTLITPQKDGATVGETLTWRLWQSGEEYTVSNLGFLIQSFFTDGTSFSVNGFHQFSQMDVVLPEVSISLLTPSVLEDSGQALDFIFTSSVSSSSTLTVNFTVSGSASASTDYTVSGAASFNGVSGTIQIPAGQTAAILQISPVGDATFESDETVIVTITP